MCDTDKQQPPSKIPKLDLAIIVKKKVVNNESRGVKDLQNGWLLRTTPPPTPLYNLPEEIWSLVFKYIPQIELISHRLVNKKWCERIDNFATFHIRLIDDQLDEKQKALCNLRVHSCEFNCRTPLSLPPFRNPGILKKIQFASTSAENVKCILKTFPHIESLTFLIYGSFDRHFDTSKSGENQTLVQQLSCLKEIDISFYAPQTIQPMSSVFDTIIGSPSREVQFPMLHKLRISFNFSKSEQMIQLFNWLGRHQTLSFLELACSGKIRLDYSDLNEISMKDLLSLRLKSLRISDNIGDQLTNAIYTDLLSVQNSLEYLTANYFGVELSTHLKVIQKSSTTLRSVKCYHVILSERTARLDSSSLFQSSCCLQELVIQCFPQIICMVLDDWGGVKRSSPSISGWQLPTSIKSLHIQGCSVPTQDLANLFNSSTSTSTTTTAAATLVNLR